MTTENLPQLPPPPAQVLPSKSRIWPLWLLSLALVVALAVLAWLGWQQLQLRDSQLTGLQTMVQQQQRQLEQLDERHQERLGRLDGFQDQVREQVQRLDRQLITTSQQLLNMGAKSRTDWLLAEAEYLLRLANQRLLMERDPAGALAILQAADGVLAETDEVALYPVRRQIAQEVVALESVAELDRTGVFLKLEALSQAVDQLQQRHDEPVKAPVSDATPVDLTDSVGEVASSLWDELKQLIVVRRLDQPAEPLLPPENEFFLRQNLRLMLEQAELALLDKNQAVYEASLAKAAQWVERYFTSPSQGANRAARAFMANLDSLRQVQVDPALPDISESLRILKSLVASIYESQQRSPQAGENGNAS